MQLRDAETEGLNTTAAQAVGSLLSPVGRPAIRRGRGLDRTGRDRLGLWEEARDVTGLFPILPRGQTNRGKSAAATAESAFAP
jgi:hypothetical protein